MADQQQKEEWMTVKICNNNQENANHQEVCDNYVNYEIRKEGELLDFQILHHSIDMAHVTLKQLPVS